MLSTKKYRGPLRAGSPGISHPPGTMPVIAFVGSHAWSTTSTQARVTTASRQRSRVPLVTIPGASPWPPLGLTLPLPWQNKRDFLLATRSLSFEVQLLQVTTRSAGYQPVSKEIPTLVSIFAFGVSRVRGVTLMAHDSRCSRQAVLLYTSLFVR